MQKLGKAVLLIGVMAFLYEALIPQFIVKSVKVLGRQIYPMQGEK